MTSHIQVFWLQQKPAKANTSRRKGVYERTSGCITQVMHKNTVRHQEWTRTRNRKCQNWSFSAFLSAFALFFFLLFLHPHGGTWLPHSFQLCVLQVQPYSNPKFLEERHWLAQLASGVWHLVQSVMGMGGRDRSGILWFLFPPKHLEDFDTWYTNQQHINHIWQVTNWDVGDKIFWGTYGALNYSFLCSNVDFIPDQGAHGACDVGKVEGIISRCTMGKEAGEEGLWERHCLLAPSLSSHHWYIRIIKQYRFSREN